MGRFLTFIGFCLLFPAICFSDQPSLGLYAISSKVQAARLREAGVPPCDPGGIYVTDVIEDGPAEKAGIVVGDVIIRIGGKSVDDEKSYTQATSKLIAGSPTKLHIRREDKTIAIEATPLSALDMKVVESAACPVRVFPLFLKENSIGIPRVYIGINNRRSVAIEAIEMRVECFDGFNEKAVDFTGSNVRNGQYQETLEAHASTVASLSLDLIELTKKVRVTVLRVRMEDSSEWKPASASKTKIADKGKKREPPKTDDSRSKWVNTSYDSTLRHVREKIWEEIDNKTGKVKWQVTETNRTDDHIEFRNEKQKQDWRVSATKMELKKDGKWEWLSNGKWND